MRKVVVVTALALAASALWIVPASAQLPPPHEHVLTTPAGPVDVGPPKCGNERLQQAFLNFHFNVHFGAPSETLAIAARLC